MKTGEFITSNTIAYLCNDLKNAEKYYVKDNYCYYNGKFIGTVTSNFDENGIYNIYFIPTKPVKKIEVKFSIKNINEIDFT